MNRQLPLRERILWGVLVIGIGLRAWEFLGSRSLAFDEINLVRNVAERDWIGLLHPLSYGQVAPVGFVLLLRLCWKIFGTDWGLRVIPFMAGIGSLFLFRALARRIVQGPAAVAAMVLFAVGEPFIRWSAQAKQYSTNIFLTLALLLLTLRVLVGSEEDLAPRAIIAGVVGFVAVWFSSAAVFVVGGIGAALVILALARRLPGGYRTLLRTVLPWFLGAGGASFVRLLRVSPATLQYMRASWAHNFAPWPPLHLATVLWYWQSFHGLFNNYFAPSPVPVIDWTFAFLALIGFWVIGRADIRVLAVLAGPLVATFGAAQFRLYPFAGRLVVFLAPIVLLGACSALAWLMIRVREFRFAPAAVMTAVMAPPLLHLVQHPPVYQEQHPRQQMAWLARHRQPGDALLISYWAIPAWEWYGPRYGLMKQPVSVGGCWVSNPRHFLEDVEQLEGRPRAWIVMAAAKDAEQRLMRTFADTIGVRLDSARFDTGSLNTLYDFSRPARWAAASAATFPVELPRRPVFYAMSCDLLFHRSPSDLGPS